MKKGMRLLCLQLEASCLQWSFFTYSWPFLLLYLQLELFFTYSFSFFTYSWSSFGYSGKVCLIRDCKQRSLTVSKKAPTVSKEAKTPKKWARRTAQMKSNCTPLCAAPWSALWPEIITDPECPDVLPSATCDFSHTTRGKCQIFRGLA